MSVLQKLTEGIIHRDIGKEGTALLNKWEKTGLLEGMPNERAKNTMAVLLENQAKELLREASSMAAGDVEGFAAVAFPIVRRVFGGLIANDLVSVQPMSLPSGLIFFLDFTHTDSRAGVTAGESLYGGRVVASALTGGVDLSHPSGSGGFYDLNTGYTSPTGSCVAIAGGSCTDILNAVTAPLSEAQRKNLRFDPDLIDMMEADVSQQVQVVSVAAAAIAAAFPQLNKETLNAIHIGAGVGTGIASGANLVRRLTRLDSSGNLLLTYTHDAADPGNGAGGFAADELRYPMADSFANAFALGAVAGGDSWGLEEAGKTAGAVKDSHGHVAGVGDHAQRIPEIDIKVDSIAVTAITKKLKAKWTPELGQDLNAYHNLDAEVELTGILSEQIALEIDQEILGDLIVGAKAGTQYWSRSPGLFVNRTTGSELGATAAAPDFTGTVSEWYETLVETINDVSAQIHRKTLRGGANFIVCGPEVANILEFTSGFRASVTADDNRGSVGTVKSGSISKKWDVYVDPYFPRNVILVGRKGGSFLESGFVYAPYVPLQVTPTIFGTEDFVPRKGVMTRYAKKMVRPDMYGLVIVRGLLGESGAS